MMKASDPVQATERLEDILSRWRDQKARYQSVNALVSADNLIDAFLNDLNALAQSSSKEQTVNLTEAARISGYSRQHLGGLVKTGKLHNFGKHHAPRVRAGDLPRKPGHLPETIDTEHVSATSRGQIVRSIIERDGTP